MKLIFLKEGHRFFKGCNRLVYPVMGIDRFLSMLF